MKPVNRMSVAAFRRLQAAPTLTQRNQALGRLPAGQMNRTEAAYAEHLKARQAAGDVLWWKFEAMRFRLANNTFFTPDFSVLMSDCTLQQHEIKGAPGMFLEDAKVKVKVAASLYPMPFLVAYPIKPGGGWRVEEVSA